MDRKFGDGLIQLTEYEIEALLHGVALDGAAVRLDVRSDRVALGVHPDVDGAVLADKAVVIVGAEELRLGLHLLLDAGELFRAFVVVLLHQVDVVEEHRTLRNGLIELVPGEEACGVHGRCRRIVALPENEVIDPHSPGELGFVRTGDHPAFAVGDGFVFGDEGIDVAEISVGCVALGEYFLQGGLIVEFHGQIVLIYFAAA